MRTKNPLPDVIPSNRKLRKLTNDDRIRLVIEILKRHPERHVQENWFSKSTGNRWIITSGDKVDPTCGTACCVRGWGQFLKPKSERYVDSFYPMGDDPFGFDDAVGGRLYNALNDRERLIEALSVLVGTPADLRTIETLDDLGITAEWLKTSPYDARTTNG